LKTLCKYLELNPNGGSGDILQEFVMTIFTLFHQLQRPDHLKKLAILETCLKLFDREVDAYWLAKGFFHFSTKFIQGHVKFKELLKMKLEIEDSDLYKYNYCCVIYINFKYLTSFAV
jgi:hypothetical protein